ncbi:MAG TPA: glutamate--tRNA ligase [Bacteroidota bacterium]|nr:glutamate--tRNA ligase [Bacteroidota bacterium]
MLKRSFPASRPALSNIRVRFAPSPTGYLHVGGLRTALYNYLFAHRAGGVFVLRIEDTDRSRIVEGAVQNLIDTLRWAGLTCDEGPVIGGRAGPYIQSERIAIYRRYADELLANGKAYWAFDTPAELEEMRKAQERMHLPSKYDRRALRLNPDEVRGKLSSGVPGVVRMLVPDGTVVAFDDLIRGRVEFASERIDDQVLLKSDGYPTYHLANVVDDHLMGITHVIRGEEWLSSTPKHVLLYRYFGWELPAFAHLPLLLNPDRSKLSKRQGDVSVEDYRKKGYLPEALVNFVALLGWNPGDEREIFSLKELIGEFTLDRVGKAGAVFNVEKLNWLNAQHLRSRSDVDLLVMLRDALHDAPGIIEPLDDTYLLKIIAVMRERVSFVSDFLEKTPYFFRRDIQYDPEIAAKRWGQGTAAHLVAFLRELDPLESPTKEEFESALRRVAASLGIRDGELIHPLRLAVSGMGAGPGLYDILSILGKGEVVRRVRMAIEKLGEGPWRSPERP